jgi:hypothetical protein
MRELGGFTGFEMFDDGAKRPITLEAFGFQQRTPLDLTDLRVVGGNSVLRLRNGF